MTLSTQTKGTVTELSVATYLLSLGYNVSQPLSQDSRYDLIVDVNGIFLRLQVKTATVSKRKDAIIFNCRSTTTNSRSKKSKVYNESEIDFFATYWDNKAYLVPVKECGNCKSLHLVPPKQSNWPYIDNYLADKVLENYASMVFNG